ncbi:unnamed protein product [Oppiella nova]|uniref:Uncharacterized protein n=1 Tax=Oppiella nova TaxID=334625 RepID=A0A7R9LC89_9ACAR|nr:unnamed protein product [Oppiella nova]CAG2161593.1 unnamed protein product [Oppiella nova]
MKILYSETWNSIQSEYQCCGIDGPFDYNMTALIEQNYETVDPQQLFPKSCCRENLPVLPNEQILMRDKCVTSYDPDLVYIYGCYDHIHHWLQHSADLLSILGFCVITFIKVCFLAILRYEIKEMIQKIKVLNDMTEAAATVPVHDLEAYLPRPSVVQMDASQSLLANACTQSTYRTDKPYHSHHHHSHLFSSACGSCVSDKPRGNSITATTGNVSDLSQCQSQSQSKKQSLV